MTAMNEDDRKTCALVVEDDPNIVDLIRSNLAVRGFDTVVSVDGMRALQLLSCSCCRAAISAQTRHAPRT